MIMTNKLLPVALVAALIGGSVGAFVMHSRNQSTTADTATTPAYSTSTNGETQFARYEPNTSVNDPSVPAQFDTTQERTAYKSGFADGFRSCEAGVSGNQVSSNGVLYSQPRVVYRNSGRSTVARSSSSSRRVYYDYQRPRSRSFWQKHRDKLTVAMGTGGGALLGGIIGGKKGAGIGALAGAGGSALYTYKLRNRNRRY
ncbi:MAG: hypothetical protein QOF62_274 [Pyrinomonadaceae bacterium]|jgi:hypothetical protein|nr:hypothetical protein [Pyrinomonadaceae bacterium]